MPLIKYLLLTTFVTKQILVDKLKLSSLSVHLILSIILTLNLRIMEARILKATTFVAKNGVPFASFTLNVVTPETTTTDGEGKTVTVPAGSELVQYAVNPENMTLGFEADIVSVDAITNAGEKGLEILLKATVGLRCEIVIDDDDNVEFFSTNIPSERVAFVEKALDKFISRG